MSRACRRRASHLRVVAQGMPDRDIVVAWAEAETGETADRVVDGLMAAINTELSAVDLGEAVPTGIEAAVLRVALRGVVVRGLRKNLIRRVIAAREAP